MGDSEIKKIKLTKNRTWKISEKNAILKYFKDMIKKNKCIEKPTSSAFLEKMLKDLNLRNVKISQLKNKVLNLRKSYVVAMQWRDQNRHDVEDDFARSKLLEMCPYFDVFSKIFDSETNEKNLPKRTPTHIQPNEITLKRSENIMHGDQQTLLKKKPRGIRSQNDDDQSEKNENFISDHQQAIPIRMLMDCAVISMDTLGKIVHRCLICNQTIESHPIAHIRNHFKDLFECHICQKSCDSLEFLVEHVNLFHSHEVPNSDEGDPLDIAILEIENVDSHLDTEADYNDECETVISLSDEKLNDHNYQLTWNSKYEGNEFYGPDGTSSVIDHEEYIFHDTQDEDYLSKEDSLEQTKAGNLLNFEVVQNDSDERKYPCELCSAEFGSKPNLKRHFLIVHLRYKKFQCEVCGKQFGGKNNLLRHASLHKDQSEKEMHECSVCEKKFSEKGNLIQHMRSHTGEKPYKCTVCGKTFSNCSYSRQHMNIHTGERPYQCFFCNEAFAYKRNCEQHMRRHTKHKPHQCEKCLRHFWTKNEAEKCKCSRKWEKIIKKVKIVDAV